MKFLIDFSCPTDVLLFKGLKAELERREHKVFLTTRNFGNNYIYRLAEQYDLFPDVIGHHGLTLYDKLVQSGMRIISLATHIKHNIGLDDFCGVISNSNPEICRAGYGLGVKVFSWNDSPDLQVAQTRLTTSLSDWVFTPWVVPRWEFSGCIPKKRVYVYDCLFPMAWLPDLKMDPFILYEFKEYGNPSSIAFRESESRAAYLDDTDVAIESVKELSKRHQDWKFFSSPRYSYQSLLKKFGKVPHNVLISREPIDFPSLLSKCDLFIGGGGTMMIEAAYYGTPVISTRAKTTYYEKYLMDEGLVFREESVSDVVVTSERIMDNAFDRESYFRKSRAVFVKEYPLEDIVSVLET